MTIPTLMAKYNEIQTVQKVKKFYSTLSQAFQLAREEYGDVDSWQYGDYVENDGEAPTKFFQYLKPYIKIIADCGTEVDACINYPSATEYSYLTKTVQPWSYSGSVDYYRFILMDGSHVWFRVNGRQGCLDAEGGVPNVCALFMYDVNGANPPNKMGQDLFAFQIKPNFVQPHSQDDCYLNKPGYGCAKHIIQYGNWNYPKSKNN